MPGHHPVVLALDWNGTVVDDAARAHRALLTVLGRRPDLPLTPEEFSDGFRMPLSDWFTRYGVAAGDLAAAQERWNAEMARHPTVLSAGARKLLRWCRDSAVPVRVLSGADGRLVEADARALGVLRLLDDVAASAHPKWVPLQAWNGGAGRLVFVGDTEYDVAEGRRAGVVAVGFAGGYRSEETLRAAGPEHLVDDLADVIPVLQALGAGAHRTRLRPRSGKAR